MKISKRNNRLKEGIIPYIQRDKKEKSKRVVKVDRLYINRNEYLPENQPFNPHQRQTQVRHQVLELDNSGRT